MRKVLVTLLLRHSDLFPTTLGCLLESITLQVVVNIMVAVNLMVKIHFAGMLVCRAKAVMQRDDSLPCVVFSTSESLLRQIKPTQLGSMDLRESVVAV